MKTGDYVLHIVPISANVYYMKGGKVSDMQINTLTTTWQGEGINHILT